MRCRPISRRGRRRPSPRARRRASRTAIARAFSAPAARIASSAVLVGAQLARSARAPARASRRRPRRRRPSGRRSRAPAHVLPRPRRASTPRAAARMSIRLVTPGLSGAADDLRAGVGDRALDLLLDRLRARRARRPCPPREPPVVDIFRVGSCRSMIRAPTSGMRCSGTTSTSVAEARVEAPRDVAHQLEVLALVLADRHLVRRGRRARRRPAAPGRRAGPRRRARAARPTCRGTGACGCSSPSAVTDDSSQHQLGVLVHVGLAEQDAAVGIEPRGEQDRASCRSTRSRSSAGS